MARKYSEKATSPNKQKKEKERKKHVWLSGRLHIEGRLNEGPRLQRKHKDENEAKQNKCNTTEKNIMKDIISKPNARGIHVRATCGMSTISTTLPSLFSKKAGRPSSSVGNLETFGRWDVSSNPRTRFFPNKNSKTKTKKTSRERGERFICGHTKFDFAVDKGNGRLHPSRDKN